MWYLQLTVLEKIYFYIAVLSSVVLVIQTIAVFAGAGETDGDVDVSFDDGDPGLRIFSIRGLLAFLCIAGWSGLLFSSFEGFPVALTIILSIILGGIALVAVAYLYRWISKLQADGTKDPKDAIGKIGDVYLPIAANKAKSGKVSVLVSGRLSEMDAITDSTRDLKRGEKIKVTGIIDGNVLIVMPLTE
ncbi:MAG: NfeD family protein [Christensenellaceae bacterium]|jgi:membrane protein implicated in regulation of membrane protease activity|nr:NfeD family protein [Christensenellaceae bacterium]